MALSLAAGAQFTDDFSDGDFTNNPAWDGDVADFIVNASQQLQLNNTVAGTSQLRSANLMPTLDDMEWRVRVKQTFAGSGSNYGRVYIVSDQADLNGPLNGYYLQFGEAGSNDAIELFEQTGTTSVSVCRGTEAQIANSFDVGVEVKRDAAGNWQLLVDPAGGTSYALQASGTSNAHHTSAFIGVRCTYTASNANKFFFDDFYAGPIILDTTPPTIVSVTATGADNVDVLWNEPLNPAAIGGYDILPFIGASAATLDGTNPALVHLAPAVPLSENTLYSLHVSSAEDLAGNEAPSSVTDFMWTVLAQPQPGEVVINEIMPDPTPVVQLPDAEYVELFNNTTDRVFDLAGWTFSTWSTQATLPAYQLLPGEYVVFVNNGKVADFAGIADVQGWSLSNTALLNAGTTLTLTAPGGTVIDQVTYSDAWYNDPVKKDGGWSLERKDPFTPCSDARNWTASTDPRGGTPGEQNSVFEPLVDNEPPALLMAYVMDEATVDLLFNEMMDGASLMNGTYTFEPALGIDSRELIAPERIRLHLNGTLIEGQLYTVTVSDVSDCPGNPIGSQNTVSFALPEPLAKGDVVINEVLYDPRGSGSDFVELYNRSQKVVSLEGLQLANVTNGAVANARTITTDPYLLLPGEYVAIASDVANVLMNYPLGHADRMLQMALPNYNNGSGTVVFLGQAGNTLDWFAYSDALHFPLLKSVDGVSLERVDPDRPTDDPTNWHSAAAEVNFATPGYRNSQYAPAPEPRGSITIDPAIFSPDNDGHQDLLTITYEFDEPGFVGTMKVFDLAGREVQTLMNNVLLGTSGSVSWDGMMDTNELARIGPYVIYMEAYDLDGNVEKFRKTVVLAHRL